MLSTKKYEDKFFEILDRFFEKHLNRLLKNYLETIINNLLADKYLLNSP
jgi:hypothetical protein